MCMSVWEHNIFTLKVSINQVNGVLSLFPVNSSPPLNVSKHMSLGRSSGI